MKVCHFKFFYIYGFFVLKINTITQSLSLKICYMAMFQSKKISLSSLPHFSKNISKKLLNFEIFALSYPYQRHIHIKDTFFATFQTAKKRENIWNVLEILAIRAYLLVAINPRSTFDNSNGHYSGIFISLVSSTIISTR